MFIVIEGTDSSGKSTQMHMLKDRLEKLGYSIELLHFPNYETPGGKLVAAYLCGDFGKLSEVSPEFAALLYSVDRYYLKDELFEKLSKNNILITDRYTQSNLGFQGAKFEEGRKKQSFIKWMEEVDSRLPQPNHIIFLDMPTEAAAQLNHEKKSPQARGGGRDYLKGKTHDIHEESKKYQDKVRETYLDIAEEQKWMIIKCAVRQSGKWRVKTPEEIHEEIWEKVEPLIYWFSQKPKLTQN